MTVDGNGGEKRHSVLVPIANGSEEIETSCITDTLVRSGCSVVVASVEPTKLCLMSRGLKVEADVRIEEVVDKEFDLIVIPGGMPGSEHLSRNMTLQKMLKDQHARKAKIAAICAAPAVVLSGLDNMLADVEATCYPAQHFTEKLGKYVDKPVVVSGHITTSQGPGTALVFSLSLVEQLFGSTKALTLAGTMLLDSNENW